MHKLTQVLRTSHYGSIQSRIGDTLGPFKNVQYAPSVYIGCFPDLEPDFSGCICRRKIYEDSEGPFKVFKERWKNWCTFREYDHYDLAKRPYRDVWYQKETKQIQRKKAQLQHTAKN